MKKQLTVAMVSLALINLFPCSASSQSMREKMEQQENQESSDKNFCKYAQKNAQYKHNLGIYSTVYYVGNDNSVTYISPPSGEIRTCKRKGFLDKTYVTESECSFQQGYNEYMIMRNYTEYSIENNNLAMFTQMKHKDCTTGKVYRTNKMQKKTYELFN